MPSSVMTKTLTDPIQLIYAGGTFGSYGRPLAPLPAEVFLPTLQTLLAEPDHAHHLPPISWLDNTLIKDSSQLTPVDFVHFYQLILAAYAQGHRRLFGRGLCRE
ncbi:hypothetical protein NK638_02265 [Psychrobacter sp. A3]|uniref:hypothetical protein n=1 Tax=Psychrobacter sp. A3 TaxID=2992754 RepID=UPI00237B5458|nr:hypothetical protein [Psychrobacter sp. A3]MDE0490379.1 hypothetical protein [Psychrobacter sp. A3]